MLEESESVGCCFFNFTIFVFQTSASDDEEDLEQLRLAALQTIKKNHTIQNNSELLHNQKPFYKKGNKRGRGFRPVRNVS